MGRRITKRRIKRKAIKKRGSNILAGTVDRVMALRGHRSGYVYLGSLKKKGEVSYIDTSFPSPNAPASAVLGKEVNG